MALEYFNSKKMATKNALVFSYLAINFAAAPHAVIFEADFESISLFTL